MLGTNIITFGVKNKSPQVSFNSTAGDSLSVSSHEFDDMKFCDFMDILEGISSYGAQAFALHGPEPPLLSYMITCTLPYRRNEIGDILHSLGHSLLTLGDDFTSHGSMFKVAIS